ncbi:MAG TPA: two-component regulator propeller domain-containing protein [Lacunisphaera sp.]
MSPYPRTLVTWTLALLAVGTAYPAATSLAEGYSLRVWRTEDGLPENLVTSAMQTRDGYMWFGTYSGLVRFDGEQFRVFNSVNTPEFRDERVARLFEDAQGMLWIGHEAGGITQYRDGQFRSFALAPGTENERITGIGSDEKGRLWAMRDNGALDSLDGGQRLSSLITPYKPENPTWTRNASGNIWFAKNGHAARLAEGTITSIDLAPMIQHDLYVLSIAASADNGAWIFCDSRIRKWKEGRWTEDRGEFPWRGGALSCSLELRDGTVAVGTIYSGLYLVFKDGRRPVHFDRTNGLPQNWVRFLYEDREGNIWAGAGNAGLVSIHTSAFSVLNSPDQWQGCSVVSVAPGRNDALWVGTDGAGLYHYTAGEWEHYGDAEGLANWYIPAVTETPEGTVWAGNYWWGGPYRLEKGRFIRPKSVDETSSPVLALLPVPGTGELLVGNRDGLLQLNEERSRWLIKSPKGTTDDVCAVALERDGAIWCGFSQGGLARLHDGKLSFFRREDGLGSDSVQCLFSDVDGSLWIGTANNGLTRFKNGRFANLGMAHGLADNIVCHILDDGSGYFWMSTRHGIQRVAKAELNRWADGLIPTISSQIYDRSDGLPVIEFVSGRQAAGCKTPDGRLWFPSSKGLISINPTLIQPNPIVPPVVIDSLVLDGKSLPVVHGSVPGHLTPEHQRLEFRASGLSYVAPSKVLFKYRLEGFDKTWIDAGSKRTVSYSRLPAGSYRFRVIACNNDGLWNTEGASVAFTIAPFFWETWWFVSSCILAAIITVALLARHLTRRRMQRQIEEMERQNAVERERARIAQDIHDDIGASLSRITMLTQASSGQLAEPEHAATVLSRIYTTARDITGTLDEIVWAVDPRHDTLDSLADYMGTFAQEYLAAAALRCRLDLPVKVPAWPLTAEVRHNLFLAFKEALHNAVKHAGASQVLISLKLKPDQFELMVQDNGLGFDPPPPGANETGRPGPGNGLTNMQLRLARVGGRCELRSAPGKGTSVSFIVGFPGPTSVRPPFPPSVI